MIGGRAGGARARATAGRPYRRLPGAVVGMAVLGLQLAAVVAGVPGIVRLARAQDLPTHPVYLPLLLRASLIPTPPPPPPPPTRPTATATVIASASATHGPEASPTVAATATSTTVATGEATATNTTAATPAPKPTLPASCGALPSWEDGKEPAREIHVAPGGDDAAGDGSAARPFRSLARAARDARPGTALRLHPGDHAGGAYLEDLRGTEAAPIWLGGLPGAARPRLLGGANGIQLVRAAWLVVHDLEVSDQSGNGLNVDDGGATTRPGAAGPLIFRDLFIHDVGSNGNQDCLKLSGIEGVLVHDARFSRCGGGGAGSAIDMVGVHRALVARSTFQDLSGNALQAKGGSSDVELRWSRLLRAGERGVNMGGSTGLDFFRPPLDPAAENAEARRIRVVANLFEGGVTPWAFVGCVDCLAAHNTVLEPERWMMRILQETTDQGGFRFAPARDGRVVNNLFVFRRGQLRADVNVGGGTAPETFRFQHNLWYAVDNPGRSAPALPVPEQGGVVGRDPLLGADGLLGAGSPALGAGLPGAWVPGDLAGACWRAAPAIGAREGG